MIITNTQKLHAMKTRILKLKYQNITSKAKYVADIIFCGGSVIDTIISLPAKSIYITVKEPEGNSFMRKFRETKSSKFLLN